MNFEYVCAGVIVKDLQKSKAFYRDVLGLKVKHEFERYVVFEGFALWLADRAYHVMFGRDPDETDLLPYRGFELYFEVDNVEKAYEELKKKGVDFIHGVKQEVWGQRTIRLTDPDGHIIDIGEKVGSRVHKPNPLALGIHSR